MAEQTSVFAKHKEEMLKQTLLAIQDNDSHHARRWIDAYERMCNIELNYPENG